MSAIRAGFSPCCADLFADRDLATVVPTQRLDRPEYPQNIGRFLKTATNGPWCYTGAIENEFELVNRCSKNRELWGNAGAILRRVRDPFLLREVFSRSGIALPEVATAAAPNEGTWLVKPRRSGAGSGIRRWAGETLRAGEILQRYIRGDSVSAIFVGFDDVCLFLGSTRQLVGEAWFHAPEWHYCGSIGPRNISKAERESWQVIGDVLASEFSLRGIFGVDAVIEDRRICPLEVNPRYTASVEVLEHGLNLASMALHAAAFAGGTRPKLGAAAKWIGKAIYFAPQTLQFPVSGPWDDDVSFETWRVPRFADIPHPETWINRGEPVLTFFAVAEDEKGCVNSLTTVALQLDQLLSR
ncbi:MAG: ATP-grasp domain-containing protein [Gemmataceae bacterium]